MPHPAIRTKNILLRQFNEEDTDALFHILQEKDILKYFPNTKPFPRGKVEKLIQSQINQWDELGYAWWAVESGVDSALLGWSGLQYLPETDETEVGYLLSRSVWGRGYATETAIASLQFGFENFNFNEIIGITHPENIASQRVLEKAGLKFDLRTEYFGMDCFRYSIRHENETIMNI